MSAADPPAAGPAGDDRGRPHGLLALIRATPFTTTYVSITMVASIVLGTLWSDVESKPWYPWISYGLPSLEAGRWYTLVTGNFFALYPVYYVLVAGLFAVLTGFAELRLGTVRTLLITGGYQIGAVLATALFFLLLRDSGWHWVAVRSTETDVGFSAGMLAVFAVATATVRPPWRLRLRVALWAYVLFSIVVIGQMSDVEHLAAVVGSLPLAARLAGPRSRGITSTSLRRWPERRSPER